MREDSQQPIVIKRIKKGSGGHHGGAWKIAYADFVTAMMAFFLLMWLLGSTTKGDLKGIADFFQNPLKLSLEGGPGSGSATAAMEGGGKDLTKSFGEIAQSSDKESTRINKVQVTPEELKSKAMAERARLQDLKAKIEAVMEANPELRQFKQQMLMDMNNEGLRIQIVDDKNRPMFDLSSAELKPYTRNILRSIAQLLNQVDHSISIAGHTDAAQYATGDRGFSNWELSANRANACRRELVSAGLAETKVLRVVGVSSTVALDKTDPFNPINRRISILVLNEQAAKALLKDGDKEVEYDGNEQLDVETITPIPTKSSSTTRSL